MASRRSEVGPARAHPAIANAGWTGRALICTAGCVAFNATAHAQGSDAGQGGAQAPTLSIVPRVLLGATLTDNARLTTSNPESDLILQAGAGVRVTGNRGRVKGHLDYSLTGVGYTRNSSGNELLNELSALGNAELVDNRLFLDAGASISQQSISPFGTQSSDPALDNPNRSEVATLSLSPSLRGRLGGVADYEGRLSYATTHSDESSTSDQSTLAALLGISGGSALRGLGWAARGSRQTTDFSEGRRTESDSVEGTLSYAIDSQWTLSVIAGREANDYLSFDKQSYGFSGWGVKWTPSARTALSAQRRNRFFGSSHDITFTHRTPRSVWTYSDSREVSTGFGQPTIGSLGTVYDLLFRQFSSAQPDPVLRDAMVNEFLRVNGISPTTRISGGFLASAVTLERRALLSLALIGVRNTLTLSASRTSGRRLDTIATVADEFAGGNEIRQRGFDVNVAHRLTPQSALSVFAGWQRNDGSFAGQAGSLKTVGSLWSSAIGERASASLGARYARFGSASRPYVERALFGNFRLQF